MRSSSLCVLVAAMLCACFASSSLAVQPLFFWSNTNSLDTAGAVNSAIASLDDLTSTLRRVIEAHQGDLVLLIDRSAIAHKMGDLLSTEHKGVSALKGAITGAGSKLVLPYVDVSLPLGDSILSLLNELGAEAKMETINIKSAADMAKIVRSANSPRLFIVNVDGFASIEAALDALKTKFSESSAPYVAAYVGEKAFSKKPTTSSSSLKSVRVSQPVVSFLAVNNGTNTTDPGLFDTYNFFSEAIWMGILTSVILILVLLVGFNGISNLQTPTQFEKKSLLNAS